jgi:hypothetical protein
LAVKRRAVPMVTPGKRAVGPSATLANGATRQGGTRAGFNATTAVLALEMTTAHPDGAMATYVPRSSTLFVFQHIRSQFVTPCSNVISCRKIVD